ncbi:MAG: ribosome recycling factor [Eubacteriaceae bacterium]|jgi:ribosome recycling factor|nr:ribosome recycling factor [Eubacteriaceae bacterium]
MSEAIIKDTEERIEKSLNSLKDTLQGMRAGRANPHLLDKILVEYYGVETPLNQMATVNVPEARLITIQPFDPSTIKAIEKAIMTSDLGFNPSNDGKIVRLQVPPLTEERRKELVKVARKYGEEGKISIRNIRRKAVSDLKELEKNSEISEDQLHSYEKDIQKLTDDGTDSVDLLLKEKEAEILEV